VLASSQGWIQEIECNPVLLTDTGAIVLDALAFVDAERRRRA
jgi:hypothetical protein